MQVFEMLSLCAELIGRMRANNIKVEDVEYLPLFEEYRLMKERGEKVTYIMTYLSEKHNVSERTLYRVFSLFMRECK